MKLLGTITSPYVRKVRVCLLEKDVAFEWVADSLLGTPALIEAYNPLGKVPVLVLDDGFCLMDSQVITEFVDTLAPSPQMIPTDLQARMAVRRWEALTDGLVDAGASVVMELRRPENERSPAWIERQRAKMDRTLAYLEQALGQRAWCTAEQMNLADIATATSLLWIDFRFPDLPWRQRHPQLSRLVDTLAQRPSFQATRPNS